MGVFSWLFGSKPKPSKVTMASMASMPSMPSNAQKAQKVQKVPDSTKHFTAKKTSFQEPDWFILHKDFQIHTSSSQDLLNHTYELPQASLKQLEPLVEALIGSPPNALKIVHKLSETDLNQTDLVALVNSDPVLVGAIMKDVNSAYYGVRNQVTQVNQAIPLLGRQNVKNIALRLCSQETPLSKSVDNVFLHNLTMNSDVVSTLACQIGQTIEGVDPFDVRTIGLVLNMGKLLSLNSEIQSIIQASDSSPESAEYWEHTLAAIFVEKWEFPTYFKQVLLAIPSIKFAQLKSTNKAVRKEAIILSLSQQFASVFGFPQVPGETSDSISIQESILTELGLEEGFQLTDFFTPKTLKLMDDATQLSK